MICIGNDPRAQGSVHNSHRGKESSWQALVGDGENQLPAVPWREGLDAEGGGERVGPRHGGGCGGVTGAGQRRSLSRAVWICAQAGLRQLSGVHRGLTRCLV